MTANNIYEWTAEDCRRCLPWRSGDCNKGDFGYVALVGGSEKYCGAAKLANLAASAMRSGAGVVKLAVPKNVARAVLPCLLESTLFPLSAAEGQLAFDEAQFAELTRNVRTVAFGMGCGTGDGAKQALKWLLEKYDGTLVVDADGLNCLAALGTELLKKCAPNRVVLTPHAAEFSRLTGETVENVLQNKADLARRFAEKYEVTVLVKGAETIVSDGCSILSVKRGCAGMATAGSGDVLSGIVAAICAYNRDDITAATATAAYVNGVAGELAQEKNNPISMIASDTARCIAQAITNILNG